MVAYARRQLRSCVFSVGTLIFCLHFHRSPSAAASASKDPHPGSVQKRMAGVTWSSHCPSEGQCGLWCANIHDCKSFCFKGNARIYQLIRDTVGNTTRKQASSLNPSKEDRVMKKPKNTAILFKSHYKRFVRRFFLANSSVTDYPFFKEKGIIAFAFVESLQRILIATAQPRQVVSVLLDGGKRQVLHQGSHVYDMAVDEYKQTIFLASRNPVIYRVSAKLEKRSAFKILPGCLIYSIGVDAKNSLVYASTDKEIVSLMYDGKHRKALARCTRTSVLAVDPIYQLLYFNLEKVLYKISLLINVTTVMVSPFDNVHRLAHSGNRLYASPKRGDLLKIIDTKSQNVQKASLSDDVKVFGGVIFCVIP